MAVSTVVKTSINQCLKHVNLRLDTLTAEEVETRRLRALEQQGHFQSPVLPVPASFESRSFALILEEIPAHRPRFESFEDPSRNDVMYTYDTNYFTSPDTEVLYAIIRKFQPRTVIEVGCGNSTKIKRQAILDGRLETRLISIDPHPRTEIRGLADEIYRSPVERTRMSELLYSLKDGDVLFIDSSHEIKTGNDVVFLYLNVIPKLPPGVLIHIHDVFLPYDYPREWVLEKKWGFNEQYLVQALLTFTGAFDVLWAGHFLQRTLPDFARSFSHLNGRLGSSLWLRKAR